MPFSKTLFELGLLAYPRQFRREYGAQMTQFFRDCHRDEKRKHSRFGVARLCFRMFFDIARTAPAEQLDNLERKSSIMNNLRKDAFAVLCSLGIIVTAFLLLSYGRKNEVSFILMFGRALDALVTAGIVGNLIVFLLVKTTRLNPFRVALWTLLTVNVVLLLVSIVVGSRVDPTFAPGKLVFGYVVSFLFWLGLHWLWAKSSPRLEVSGGNNQ